MIFLKKVLSGKKKLLKLDETTIIPDVPKLQELKVQAIWPQIKNSDDIKVYFPDYFILKENLHPRKFMWTVF